MRRRHARRWRPNAPLMAHHDDICGNASPSIAQDDRRSALHRTLFDRPLTAFGPLRSMLKHSPIRPAPLAQAGPPIRFCSKHTFEKGHPWRKSRSRIRLSSSMATR
jgi:hypothetical protein